MPASSFVGRTDELAELVDFLGEARVVTLTGPSGIGKTRIAVEAARRLVSSFPDGVWLVDLAPVTGSALLPVAVAAALGLPSEPGRDATDTVFTFLQARRSLLVLDNCERVTEASSALVRALVEEAAEVFVLATSHRPLGVMGERVMPVAAMSLPDGAGARGPAGLASDAVALFCSRASTARSGDFNLTEDSVGAVVEICRRVDGLPLAIELAAARTAVLTPVEIAERLDDRFRLLTGGAAGVVPRHATLRAALAWTYELLPAAEAALLRRLSVFADGAMLAAVEEVCAGGDLDCDGVPDGLAELVARSLVVADTRKGRTRYRLLESVRLYGVDRLDEADETDVYRARHGEWCLALAEGRWHATARDDRPSEDRLRPELDNLRAGLEWASDGRAPELGLRLATALAPFWRSGGYFREGQAWLERALASPPEGFERLRARALWSVGMFAVMQGDGANAAPVMEESLALARASGAKRAEAQALNLLGFIALLRQEPIAAMPLLERSVELARETRNVPCLTSALYARGRSHLLPGDAGAARTVLEECLDLIGDQRGDRSEPKAGSVLLGLGWAALVAGQQRRGVELFGQALPLLRSTGAPFDTALVLSFLGDLARLAGDDTEAHTRFDEGRDLASAMGAAFPLARCLCGLARLALDEGDLKGARALVDESIEFARDPPLPYAYVRCLHVQGALRWARGDLKGAKAAFDEALAEAHRASDGAGISGSLHHLARLDRRRVNGARASVRHLEALAVQSQVPDQGGIAGSLEGVAGLEVDHRRYLVAAQLFGAAAALRDRSGSSRPPEERECYDADVARLTTEIEPESMAQAWADGAALPAAEAVALATRQRKPHARPTTGWEALTRGEKVTVELAAEGLTNSEIAEELSISERTVQSHLRRAFPKLSVKNRRQLRDIVPASRVP